MTTKDDNLRKRTGLLEWLFCKIIDQRFAQIYTKIKSKISSMTGKKETEFL